MKMISSPSLGLKQAPLSACCGTRKFQPSNDPGGGVGTQSTVPPGRSMMWSFRQAGRTTIRTNAAMMDRWKSMLSFDETPHDASFAAQHPQCIGALVQIGNRDPDRSFGRCVHPAAVHD